MKRSFTPIERQAEKKLNDSKRILNQTNDKKLAKKARYHIRIVQNIINFIRDVISIPLRLICCIFNCTGEN